MILFPTLAFADTDAYKGESSEKGDNKSIITIKFSPDCVFEFDENFEVDLDEIITQIDKNVILSGKPVNLVIVSDDGSKDHYVIYVINEGKIISHGKVGGILLDS